MQAIHRRLLYSPNRERKWMIHGEMRPTMPTGSRLTRFSFPSMFDARCSPAIVSRSPACYSPPRYNRFHSALIEISEGEVSVGWDMAVEHMVTNEEQIVELTLRPRVSRPIRITVVPIHRCNQTIFISIYHIKYFL